MYKRKNVRHTVKTVRCYANYKNECSHEEARQGRKFDALAEQLDKEEISVGVAMEIAKYPADIQQTVYNEHFAEGCYVCGRTHASKRSLDKIISPLKTQFPSGAEFYGTLLHEMAHSTGVESRLGRELDTSCGDADYAHEELVVEFTATLCGALLGFATTPRDENAAYLKHWLENLEADPKYLFDILTDVNRAARMITEHIGASGRESVKAA